MSYLPPSHEDKASKPRAMSLASVDDTHTCYDVTAFDKYKLKMTWNDKQTKMLSAMSNLSSFHTPAIDGHFLIKQSLEEEI